MATKLYPLARKAFADGDLDLLADDIRAILIDAADYTYSDAHDFLDDVPSGARVSSAVALTGKTTTDGVFDADDTVLPSVTGDVSEAIVLYQHTGTEATARLIAYIDNAAGLPVTPNTQNITIGWAGTTNRIFKL